MPDEKIHKACIIHAEKALGYRQTGNEAMLSRHCQLLEQCATILRDRRRGDKPKPKWKRRTADQIVRNIHINESYLAAAKKEMLCP